jgi:hypothetical protein
MVRKIYKTIHLAPWGTAAGPTVVPHGVMYPRGTVAHATAVGYGARVQSVLKNL